MGKDLQDTFARAFTTLSSLRNNVSQMTSKVPETYVHKFHTVLDKLEGISIDVAEYRIPGSEVNSKVTDVGPTSYLGGGGEKSHVSYSKEKYVDKSFILTKLDAILGYFEIITSEKPSSIGFRTPDKK